MPNLRMHDPNMKEMKLREIWGKSLTQKREKEEGVREDVDGAPGGLEELVLACKSLGDLSLGEGE